MGEDQDAVARRDAARDRAAAAARWQPRRVTLLLVAEKPPTALDRYFYFSDVGVHDSLFRHVVEGISGHKPARASKDLSLEALRDAGVFLIDLKSDPLDHTPLDALVPSLLNRCRVLAPRSIILIKATVYDTAYGGLHSAGLPVIDRRIPFPGSGRQKEFRWQFGLALTESGLPSLLDAREPTGADSDARPRTPTLHEEIARILVERAAPMKTSEIAAAVNAAGRYAKRDGTPVTRLQIHGRTRNYSDLFRRGRSRRARPRLRLQSPQRAAIGAMSPMCRTQHRSGHRRSDDGHAP